MSEYIIVYLGGNPPASPEEGQRHFARYKEWLASLGDAAISPANPLKNTHAINPDGKVTEGSGIGMSGYTLVEADSIEQAIDMAKACPFLDIGGTVEVSERLSMTL